MRRLSLFALILLMLALPLAVSAQGAVTIADLQLEFWPEYDQPAMLVIYRVRLSDDTPLPAELEFSIPTAAGAPHAVAVGSESGLVNAAYETSTDGDVTTIRFTTESPLAQFEYYDPGLSIDGEARNYDFETTLAYPVETLAARVQVPVGAANMLISPELGDGQIGGDGLTYYTGTLGSVAAGAPVRLVVSYQKSTDALSVAAFQSAADEPALPADSGTSENNLVRLLVYALLAVGLGLMGYGGYLAWQNRQAESTPRRRSRIRAASKPAAASSSGVFCHECGTAAQPGDKFCRECGTALRL